MVRAAVALEKKGFPSVVLVCEGFVSQALDTALFSVFGLYGLVKNLFEIMLVSYAVKCAIIACSSPLAALLKRFHKEAHDVPV